MMMRNLGFGCCSARVFVILIAFVICAALVGTEAFDSLLQLPGSGSPIIRPRSKRVFPVGDFGAKGDGFHNDTQVFEVPVCRPHNVGVWCTRNALSEFPVTFLAFMDAWDVACSFPGRTRIMIPDGYTFLVHPIDLAGPCKSKVSISISGAIIAPKDPASWTGLNPRKWLYFHGVNHLTVEGGGTINGRGWRWWAQSCKMNKTNPCRHAPTAITFHKCKNLKVNNLRVVDSQQMHLAFTNCIRVTASKLTVMSPAFSPNTDGIHISASRGVEVKDSVVGTGDDCISIVGNSTRIRIRNIACGPGHGISIGSLGKSNSSSLVHDVVVDGAFLSHTDNGARIKTWQGGSGCATKITFQNIIMQNVANPLIVDQYYCDSRLPCANQTSAVKVENISFIHIKGTSATEEAMKFACSDDSPCEGLYLEDIQLISSTGGITKSFCWEAYGSSVGLVLPSPCFSCNQSTIKQKVASNSLQSF